ncbi:MAG: ribbon-helix-helix domain-containing protein [Candidatus Woesearchaeota archaeon]
MGNKTVNIRISKKTAEWIDELIEQGYYNSRSEALREFVREAVE